MDLWSHSTGPVLNNICVCYALFSYQLRSLPKHRPPEVARDSDLGEDLTSYILGQKFQTDSKLLLDFASSL